MSLSMARTCSSAGCKLDAACSSQFVDSSLGEWSRPAHDDMTVERGTHGGGGLRARLARLSPKGRGAIPAHSHLDWERFLRKRKG